MIYSLTKWFKKIKYQKVVLAPKIGWYAIDW